MTKVTTETRVFTPSEIDLLESAATGTERERMASLQHKLLLGLAKAYPMLDEIAVKAITSSLVGYLPAVLTARGVADPDLPASDEGWQALAREYVQNFPLAARDVQLKNEARQIELQNEALATLSPTRKLAMHRSGELKEYLARHVEDGLAKDRAQSMRNWADPELRSSSR